jgi:enoyl-CoA hydratase
VLTGNGKAFCAGVDLKEATDPELWKELIGGPDDPTVAMAAFDRPIIGAINGVAITGGFELALACDILVAGPAARFADTHARVGIMPGWGLSQKLSRLIGISRAKEMSLTGNIVGADIAAQWGLVNRVVPAEELVEHCVQLGKDSASCLPNVVVKYKGVIDDGFGLNYDAARKHEMTHYRFHLKDVSKDAMESQRDATMERNRKLSSKL